MKRQPQVSNEHYKLENYVTHERWQSYFNQVGEVLRYNPKSVLVIGPGDGIVVNILKTYNLEITTVDIDVANRPDILASVEDLRGSGNMPDKKYDVVLCSQVLEHLPYENFVKALKSINEYTKKVAVISLPEKSLRSSLMIKLPVVRPLFLNFVVPFLFKNHKFDGEHYWELNAKGYPVSRILRDMAKVFKVRKGYRLQTNPYHFFFILEAKTVKRIFLLSDGGNPHTIKWVNSLAERGFEIFLFSLSEFDQSIYAKYPNVQSLSCNVSRESFKIGASTWKKLPYLKFLFVLRKQLQNFKPDYMHAHYATSYGLLGALQFYKPYFISVWGTDVFEFPKKGLFHKLVMWFNLKMASKVFSTSHAMAKETSRYTNKSIEVVPFGVNLDHFQCLAKDHSLFTEEAIVIGTVKTLEDKYGIEYLIRAFAKIKSQTNNVVKLLIVGKGSKEGEYKKLCVELGIANDTIFTGWIDVNHVPKYHRMFDISVFPSICEESFGVSVIEASASGKPVVVTNRGGLPEVVEDGVTGLIVPPEDTDALAHAILKLIHDPELRKRLGENGCAQVAAKYDWKDNLDQMITYYQ